ncbi:MAG: ComEC/Rec2 family competence protein [Phycisphaerae bacterium]
MHVAPLFPPAAGLVIGIVLDRGLQAPAAAYVVAFALPCALTASRRMRTLLAPLLLLAAAIPTGAMLHLCAFRAVPPSSVERYASDDRRIARIRGTVASVPRVLQDDDSPFARWSYHGERTVFLLDVEAIEGSAGNIPVSGLIRTVVYDAVLDLRDDERVEVLGWLRGLSPPDNPGSFDWGTYNRRHGVVAHMSCKTKENVRRLDHDPTLHPAARLITWFRTRVRGLLTDDLAGGSDEETSLLEAMILGHRSRLDRRLNEVFIRAGCVHFLAVSGVHVVIVMLLVRVLCRPFSCRPRTRTFVMLVSVIVYVALAEPRPPILRAGVISVLYCTARLVGRRRACMNWISASALALVIADPPTVFDAGFQLSFGAVFGVSYLTPALARIAQDVVGRLRRASGTRALVADLPRLRAGGAPADVDAMNATRWARRLVYGYAPRALAVTAGAWLATVPIVAAHFQRLQPWGALNSLLTFPLVAIVMGLGFAKLVLSALLPSLGAYLASPLAGADSLLIRFVERLGALPGVSLDVAAPPAWLMAAYYIFLLALVYRFPTGTYYDGVAPSDSRNNVARSSPWRNNMCGAAAALLIAAGVASYWPSAPARRMVVTVLAVGAGSASVIDLPDGQTIMCDAGSTSLRDVGRSVVVPFLRHRGIRRIDRLYIGHPNLDHFNGIPTILDQVEVGAAYVNRYFERKSPPRSVSRHLLDILDKAGCERRTLDPAVTKWKYGGATFELLSPLMDFNERLSTNESSTVLRLSYAGRSMLLTGDIEERTQGALVDRGGIAADVLLLPHHGSIRRNSADFFAAVDPEVAIRSSDRKMAETFNGLAESLRATTLYDTADDGAVQVVMDSRGVRVSCFRARTPPAPAPGGDTSTRSSGTPP